MTEVKDVKCIWEGSMDLPDDFISVSLAMTPSVISKAESFSAVEALFFGASALANIGGLRDTPFLRFSIFSCKVETSRRRFMISVSSFKISACATEFAISAASVFSCFNLSLSDSSDVISSRNKYFW